MEIVKVNSSAINSVAYEDGTLFIEFDGNNWYRYPNVPESLFERFLLASSKGTFVNKSIKPYFQGYPCINPKV